MNSARKQLVIGAEPPTVSPHSSRLEPAGSSLASASLGDPILDKVRENKPEAEEGSVRDGLPITKKLSEVVRTFCRTPERERRIDLLAVMRQEARGLRESFSAANFQALANFASALERLFTALAKDVGAVNGSTLKTVSHAIDFLTRAASSNSGHDEMARTPIRMLAVDDDPVCLCTLMMLASNNNGVRLVACEGAEPALRQLKTGDFDLILSDILMPGMNGFEFVAEVRKLPKHRATPVVFVTGLSDFETRSRSVLSGGCDLIAKPFTAGEVLVKALTLGLKRRFDSAAAVAQVVRQPQELRAPGAPQDSELPSPNNGGNGHATPEPGNLTLKGLAARGVIIVEEHGGIRSINLAAAELLGYSPDEAANGDVRALIPDELQSEENKTLLSQALAGKVKNKSGVRMTGRHKDNSPVQLLVALGESWVGRQRSIMCLLQPASSPVAAKEEVSPRAVDAKSASAELTPRVVLHNTTLAELKRAKEYWETCASERAALLEELKNRMRGQDSAMENLRREGETSKELLERQAQEHLERQSELKELIRAKEYWEGCAGERTALLEEQKNRLRGQDCSVEDLRRESEALKAFCKARVGELQQTRTLLERQAKEHLKSQSELQCKCVSLQEQLDSLTQSLTKESAGRTAAEHEAGELAASRKREEDLRTELKAAEAALAELEKSRTAQGQESDRTQEKVVELASRVGELESALQAEVVQRGNWERRAAEQEQARVALEGKIREWTEREGQLKLECARLEKQGLELTEALSQTQALLAKEAAGRTAAEQQAGELAASREREENLRAELKAAEAVVAGLEKNRTALGQELGQAQAKVGELASWVGELESTLREEQGQRGNLERQAAELEQARLALEGESGQQKQNLRAELKAAEAVVADLEKNRTALGQELGLAQAKVGELASRVGELESTLREEVRQRGNWEQRAIELEQARLALEGESGNQKKNLRDELKAAKAALTGLEKDRTALGQELGQTQAKVAELASRVGELESQLQAEVGQRGNWEQRAAELEQARVALQGEIREWAEREGQLKSECARLEQQGHGLTDSLSQTQALLAKEAAGRTAAQHRTDELAELRRALELELATSREREEDLRAGLKAAKAAVTGLEKNRTSLGQELGQAQAKVGELASRVEELESQLQAEIGQRGNWELRAAELEQARVALQGEIREWAEREGQLKSEHARLEQQSQGLTESLSQTQALLAKEAAGRTAAQHKTDELAELRKALEQELAASRERESKLRAGLKATEVAVTGMKKNRTTLGRELDQAQEKIGELASRVGELESQLQAEVTQRENWERRATELEQARVALQGEIREWATREDQLKSKCARLVLQGMELTESLSQTQGLLTKEAAGRTAAQQKVGELTGLHNALEQELARRKQTEEKLQSALQDKQAKLQTTNDSLSAQQSHLEAKTQELQAAQAALTEQAQQERQLKGECARLEQELQAVAESLAQTRAQFVAEAEHRTAAESQAGELGELRSALEQELARRKQAEEELQGALQEKQAQLRTTKEDLSAQQSHLEARIHELQAAQAALTERTQQERQLKGECARLEQELQAVAESLAQTRVQFAAEAEHRTAAESQAGELAELRSALEQELARRKQAEAKLQGALQEKQAQLQTTKEDLSAQTSHLEARTRDLQAAQAALAEQAQQERQLKGECARLEQELQAVAESLAQTRVQFAAEAEHRTAAESQAGELAELQSALEQEIARRKQTEEKLQSDLQEKQAQLRTTKEDLSAQQSHLEVKNRELQAAQATLRELTAANEAVAQELSAARWQQRQEELQRRRLAGMILEEQDAKAELSKQLQAVCERERAQQQAIAELEVGAQRNLKALNTLESSLETESAQRRRFQSQLEGVEARLREASRQLELKNAAEQSWRQREAELDAGVHRLQKQVISSAANITIREEELRSTTARLEESLLIQSALCGKVNDLAARECSLAQSQTEMNQQLALAQRKIEEGQKDLAALRYAVLDAQRLRLQIDHKRLQGTRQRLDGLQEVTSVLLNTPLSMAQRGVANSLKAALAGWIGDCGHSAGSEAFPVETPSFQSSEFSLGQVTESAFRHIAESAAQSNVKASTMTSGEVPDKIYGDGGHIHQLITLLADSLLRSPNARTLAVRVLVNQEPPAAAELNLLFAIESDADLNEPSKSLARAIACSNTLEAAQLGEVESGLAACWNLALAMGGSLQCDAPGDKQVNFKLVVPMGLV
jgi:PAS domain S-box-containing protein